MADNIVLTEGVRQNLLSLKNIAGLMSTTQTRLATGKQVNSALDNAVNFFTAAGLQSRAADLGALLDAMSNAIQTVNAANNGITAIVTTIQSMQSTLMQARQDATWKSSSFTLDTVTIGGASSVLNISFSGGAVTSSTNVALQTGSGGTRASLSTQVVWSNITPAARSPVLTAANNFQALDMTTGDETYSFDIVSSTGTATVTLTSADNTGGGTTLTIDEVITGINSDLAGAGSNVRARNNAGRLEFYLSSGATGSAETITINNYVTGGTTPSALTNTGFASGSTQAGTDAQTYSFTVSDGTTQKTITLDDSNADTLANAISAVNTQLGANNTFEAFDDSGRLGIREKIADGATLTIAGTDATALFGSTLVDTGTAGTLTAKTIDQLVNDINSTYAGAVKASNDGGRLQIQNLSTSDLVITGTTGGAIDGSAGTATIGGNAVRKNLVVQFNQLRDQLDKFASDASFNGINLLQGDVLRVIFNEYSTSTLDIQAKDADGNLFVVNSVNLGIATLQNVDLDSNTNIDSLLTNLTQALALARTQASHFGASLSVVQNRQDFTKQMINTLRTGADNLVVADTNEEGANMLALQTRQQLSIMALSLANQANQSVLRLFA